MPRIYLTDTFAKTTLCAEGKGQELFWDHPVGLDGKVRSGSQKGLALRITALGRAAFIHSYTFNGKRHRVVIGDANIMSVASARLLVHRREAEINAGKEPVLGRVNYRKKHKPVINDIIEKYWHGHMSAKSPKYQNQFFRYVGASMRPPRETTTQRGKNKKSKYPDFGKKFGSYAVEDIKPIHIKKYLDQITVPATWNTAHSHLNAMFNWIIRMQIIDMRNPCSPFRKKTVLKKRRDYSNEQIKTIANYIFSPVLIYAKSTDGLSGEEKKIAALENGRINTQNAQMIELCNFMGILFLTMARPTELRHARFEHFDLEQLIWHKHNTKGIKLSRSASEYICRSVPIHPKIADIIKRQRERWPDSDLVFPSHTDPDQPRDNFRKPLVRFKELEGVPEYFQMRTSINLL